MIKFYYCYEKGHIKKPNCNLLMKHKSEINDKGTKTSTKVCMDLGKELQDLLSISAIIGAQTKRNYEESKENVEEESKLEWDILDKIRDKIRDLQKDRKWMILSKYN